MRNTLYFPLYLEMVGNGAKFLETMTMVNVDNDA